MNKTPISWTQYTWNWATGCTKVGPGCLNCYMFRIYEQKRIQDPSKVVLHPERLLQPLKVKTPSKVFVNDMGDTFHSLVPDELIEQAFRIMEELAPWHTYQVLTKRINRMRRFSQGHPFPSHIWAGTSVETRKLWARAEMLKEVSTQVRFLSLEPLLEDLGDLDLTGIHWVITGGESGPRFRPMNLAWARRIRDQCVEQGVAFWYKQGSGYFPESDKYLDGMVWHNFPAPSIIISDGLKVGQTTRRDQSEAVAPKATLF